MSWSPINPETALLCKEAFWEKYNYRAAGDIVVQLRDDKAIMRARSEGRYCCDASTVVDPAAVNAARREWRARKNKLYRPEPTWHASLMADHARNGFSLPASGFCAEYKTKRVSPFFANNRINGCTVTRISP